MTSPETQAELTDHDNVLFELWMGARAAAALLSGPLASAGMRPDEFGIYSILSIGPMAPTALARWMYAPATTVSSVVKRMEAKGHLKRSVSPQDGRSALLALTPAGIEAHREAGDRYLPILATIVERLGNEKPAILQALVALRHAIEEDL